MRKFWDKYKAPILIGCVVLAGIFFVARARAEGIADRPGILGPLTSTAATPWTGLGVEAYGSWVNADTDETPSSGLTGQTVGGSISGSLQMGSLVAEAFGDYGWFFGDLNDFGAKTEMALGGRLGYLVNSQTLVYGLGALSWIDATAGSVDGWQYGAGVQYRLGNSPWFGRLEYRHGEYDTKDILYVDAVTDVVRAGITYKFGGK